MEPIVPLAQLEQIAAGIDHAEGICVAPDGTCYVSGEQGQIFIPLQVMTNIRSLVEQMNGGPGGDMGGDENGENAEGTGQPKF